MENGVLKVLARGKTAVLAVVVAVVFVAAPTALAANGKPWLLGKNNSATKTTVLGGSGGANGPMLRLVNNDAGVDDTALELQVQGGEPPMVVNSNAQVLNLNSDLVDGRSASSFVTNSTYRAGQGSERLGVEEAGGKVLTQSCNSGDRLLSGGPASVNAASQVLDSFAVNTSTWQVRINDSGVTGGDSFTVVVLCADQ